MTATPLTSHYVAALDLGSNSFHLLICQWDGDTPGSLEERERHKEMVQLARDRDTQGNLSPQALQRARNCLTRFGERLQAYPEVRLSVVGTEALRQCTNLDEFLAMAHPLLGQAVDVINADREAHLTYRGVQFTLPARQANDRVLVVDIGGASTELILGKGKQLHKSHSFSLGCVDLVNRFFTDPQDSMTRKLEQAYHYCQDQLLSQRYHFHRQHWDMALGASGTMRVLLDLIKQDTSASIIHRHHLEKLLQAVKHQGSMPASVPETMRHDVLPAGLVLMQAIFDVFSLDSLTVSKGSIKEGMLLEMLT